MTPHKLTLFLLTFASLLSCRKEAAGPDAITVISVSADESKTVLDGQAVRWTREDEIIANGVKSSSITINSPKDASFTFPGVLSAPFRCLGPASAFVSGSFNPDDGRYGSLTLPSEQSYRENSFDPAAALMYGASEKANDVTFKHGAAYLKFTVKSAKDKDRIKYISVCARGNEDMSGEAVFDPQTGKLLNSSCNGAGVRISAVSPIEQGKPIHIAILEKTYKEGIRIRIVDENNHFSDLDSKVSFCPQPGRIYASEIAFDPEGTLVEGSSSDTHDAQLTITPYSELNKGASTLNSHAGQTSRSVFSYVGGSYQELCSDVTQSETPIYPRLIKADDGRYLLFYHYAYAGTESIGWSGNMCALLESRNLRDWVHRGMIFPREADLISVYDSKQYARVCAGPDVVKLKDGTLIACACYHTNVDFRHRIRENGLVIRRSTDNGQSWSGAKYVNVGTCWEPHPVQLSSGRVVICYTDSCPYIEGVWTNNAVSTGASYIYSDDNGLSWLPENPLDKTNHLLAFRSVRAVRNGTTCYTDQMPVVIELNGSKTLVGVAESMDSDPDASDSYVIRMARSDSQGNWGQPDSKGVLPQDRDDSFGKGSSPFIVQFRSGETVVLYNNGNKEYFRFGDENAGNFTKAAVHFGGSSKTYPKGCGFWGSLYADGHRLFMLTGGEGGTARGGTGTGYFLQMSEFFLNHNIAASAHPVTLDGDNSDWSPNDEALFAGSGSSHQSYEKYGEGKMHATLRCSRHGQSLYLLIEVENPALDPQDGVYVWFSNPDNTAISANDICLQKSLAGGFKQFRYSSSSAKASAELGAGAALQTGSGCYAVEMSVPLPSLPLSGGRVLVNFAVQDAADGLQSINPTNSSNTVKWQSITSL